MPDWWDPIVKSLFLIAGLYVMVAYLSAAERMIVAYDAGRIKPKWSGLWGLIDPLPQGLRFFFHDFAASSAGLTMARRLAAVGFLTTAILAFAAIPFGSPSVVFAVVADLDVDLLFVLSVSGLVACGIGFSESGGDGFGRSNVLATNLAGLGLSTVGVVLLSGSLRLERIVAVQWEVGTWWIALQPLGFAAFLVCLLSQSAMVGDPVSGGDASREEINSRAESIPGGVLALAGWLHVLALAYLVVILFLGGWHFRRPIASEEAARLTFWHATSQFVILHLKVLVVAGGLIWFRRYCRKSGNVPFVLQAWKVSLLFGFLNMVVTLVNAEFLTTSALTTKVAVAWGVLLVGLPMTTLLFGKPESR